MELNYQLKSGQLYAKVPGHSVRRDNKIILKPASSILDVIDKEHNVFYSRERGIFTYDPETGSFGKADETYVSDLSLPIIAGRNTLCWILEIPFLSILFFDL